MDHGPSTEWGKDHASEYKTRLGLWMFLVYSIVYAGFVAINSIWPKLMERVVGSVNLAVVYGFALIVLALVMALIYNALSGRAEERFNNAYTDDEEEDF
ncbi:MAG: DUF485 domain-containing protein [Armatimonadota bacterium]